MQIYLFFRQPRISFRLSVMGLLLMVVACSFLMTPSAAQAKKKKKAETVLPADAAWIRAKDLFERGKYYRAQELLKAIALNYSGSEFIDSSQFMVGRCSFELGDHLVAADEFRRVITQYPTSKVAGEAAYYEARSMYELSPAFTLDQETTERALDAFQRYLEEYPGHAQADSAYKYLGLAREKLAHKDYAAAELYSRMEEYSSAALYADLVLSDYYDTSWSEPALFLKGETLLKLGEFGQARDVLTDYITRYPDGRSVERAKTLIATATKRAQLQTSSAADMK